MTEASQDGRSAQFISLFNGVISIAIAGARAGWLKSGDIDFMHKMMTKPLDLPEHAGNEGLAAYQQMLEGLIVELREAVERRKE